MTTQLNGNRDMTSQALAPTHISPANTTTRTQMTKHRRTISGLVAPSSACPRW